MTATKWIYVYFDDGKTKGHIVPASLRAPLLADLKARIHDIAHKIKPCPRASMDQPGMCHTDRPWEAYKVAGMPFEIPSEDTLDFLERIKRMEIRRFARGQQYFKLHCWTNCMVLRPWHKTALELQLAERLQGAELRASAFYADKKSGATILREIAARQSNVSIDKIPDLGGQKPADRFIPRHRGQA